MYVSISKVIFLLYINNWYKYIYLEVIVVINPCDFILKTIIFWLSVQKHLFVSMTNIFCGRTKTTYVLIFYYIVSPMFLSLIINA